MFGPIQVRMGRAALGWSSRELARRAELHHNTVNRIENGADTAKGTMLLLKVTLEKHGVAFREDGSVDPPADPPS